MTNTVCTLRRFALGRVTATLETLEQIKAYFTVLGCAALFVSVVASFTNPTPAVAQESRSATIEEVIVTARKRQEAAQDVPIAITAITRELESATIRNLQDLNGFAPNVQIVEDGSRGGGGASINIRGISPTRTDDNSFDSPVAVMIDGIYLGSLAGQVIENFDLDRIEILRGPQGTLFGKNTVGGVINVFRSRPTGEFGGRLKATVGEDGQQEFRAVLNAPIMEDVLAVKAFGTYQEDDGYYDNVTTGDNFGDTEYKNYGLTLLWTPNDTFEATLTAEKFDDDSKLNAYHTNYNLLPGLLPPPTDPNGTDYSGGHLSCALSGVFSPQPECRTSLSTPGKSEGDQNNDAHLETDAYTLNMSYDLNDFMTLVSVTGYRDMDEYRIFDFDGSAFPFITIERWNDGTITTNSARNCALTRPGTTVSRSQGAPTTSGTNSSRTG
jgi:iron complex outermembrane receptor protein